ncbi:hypothetical protein LTR56_019579 [Elasticomyces elasticus]|nr:hypothetical protein LTR56_019579 [Elasticomyces elasticus]KAK3662581.1 hypothetical protein LTR22_006647 [Elasticomyces elasticus]KAK4927925.1 hypothetical protein LTR49_005347 [Elasticomyces elasticus]KAK5756066.1 hypothetical protein LTS12_013856 [Elasticomyces elasticus]
MPIDVQKWAFGNLIKDIIRPIKKEKGLKSTSSDRPTPAPPLRNPPPPPTQPRLSLPATTNTVSLPSRLSPHESIEPSVENVVFPASGPSQSSRSLSLLRADAPSFQAASFTEPYASSTIGATSTDVVGYESHLRDYESRLHDHQYEEYEESEPLYQATDLGKKCQFWEVTLDLRYEFGDIIK